MDKKIGKRKLAGIVVSDKMSKTAVVEVFRFKEHPRYRKRIKVSRKFKAHDEKNQCKIGDLVVIEEIRPISKDKKWKISEITKKSVEPEKEEVSSEIK